MASVSIQTNGQMRQVGDGQPVFVIAEIGKNFIQSQEEKTIEEYLQNAIALVKAAKAAGADAVKFQTHNVEDEQANIDVTSPHFTGLDRYRWVSRNTNMTPLETFWKPLQAACEEIGILFFSTPMSRGAAYKLQELDPPLWKVGSGDILDFVLLDVLRTSGKPIVISAGMSTLEETDKAIAFIREKTDQVVLLHCVSRYPCPPEDLHLKTVEFFRDRYQIPVGFSDHSVGIESAIGAAALGACVIEKHFSFDRNFWGSDHKVSLLPEELAQLVQGVARVREDDAYRASVLSSEIVQKGMGTEAKILDEGEAAFRPLFRKTLVAARDIAAGELLKAEDVYAMRPQAYLSGLPSEAYPDVLGKKLAMALKRYQPITPDAVV